MWDKILNVFKEALDKAEATYIRKATSKFPHSSWNIRWWKIGFNCTNEENEVALTSLRKRCWLGLRAKVDEQTVESILLVKLKLIFEEKFRYDDAGVPRVWKPTDDIDTIFKKAKESVRLPFYFSPRKFS